MLQQSKLRIYLPEVQERNHRKPQWYHFRNFYDMFDIPGSSRCHNPKTQTLFTFIYGW